MTTSAQIANLAGAAVTSRIPLHGGDLSRVERVDLVDGRSVVAKHGAHSLAKPKCFASWHRKRPRAQGPGAKPRPDPFGVPARDIPKHRNLGQPWQSLRKMHDTTGSTYGWSEDYAFGAVGIPNTQAADWPDFWAQNRLLAGVKALPPDIAKRLDTLAKRLPDLLPKAPPAALLHGDLWGGNVLFTARTAYLIDPACYYGDAEVDLAMLTLFGRPPLGFCEAYGPLRPGHEKRRPVYQLWPALVHLRLFGAGYRGMVTGLLDSLGT